VQVEALLQTPAVLVEQVVGDLVGRIIYPLFQEDLILFKLVLEVQGY
jgi:hypothetical protein